MVSPTDWHRPPRHAATHLVFHALRTLASGEARTGGKYRNAADPGSLKVQMLNPAGVLPSFGRGECLAAVLVLKTVDDATPGACFLRLSPSRFDSFVSIFPQRGLLVFQIHKFCMWSGGVQTFLSVECWCGPSCFACGGALSAHVV